MPSLLQSHASFVLLPLSYLLIPVYPGKLGPPVGEEKCLWRFCSFQPSPPSRQSVRIKRQLVNLREGWLRQIGWIFGKVPKGGGSFSKICVVDFWNFSVQNLYIHNLHFAFALCNWVSTNNYRDVHFLLVFETLTSAAAMIWSQRATFGHFLFVFLLTLVFQTSARTNHDFLCTLRSLQSNLHVSF